MFDNDRWFHHMDASMFHGVEGRTRVVTSRSCTWLPASHRTTTWSGSRLRETRSQPERFREEWLLTVNHCSLEDMNTKVHSQSERFNRRMDHCTLLLEGMRFPFESTRFCVWNTCHFEIRCDTQRLTHSGFTTKQNMKNRKNGKTDRQTVVVVGD